MKQLHVKTSTHDYTVSIDEGLRFRLGDFLKEDYSAIFIITDDTVSSLYKEEVLKGLKDVKTYHYTIPSGEASKGINMYYTLQTELMERQLDRRSLIIALGGGVVGDLAGFVAATYMRGIDYIQVPTTILAHDSSVGGKVAINHELGKNMIGCFYPPVAVVYDVATLESLPKQEIRSGYAELVKEAFIANEAFLQQLLATSLSDLNREQLKQHLSKGIEIKADIVEKDEKEADIRMFLNFGHTLAHAIETEMGYGKITHGEAVAIGMLFALKLSAKHTGKNFPYDTLLQWFQENDYPLSLYDLAIPQLLEHMKRDKKSTYQHIQMVLLEEIGSPIIVSMTEEELYQALTEFKKELSAI